MYYDTHEAYRHNDVTRVEYHCEDDRPGTGDYRFGYDTEVSKNIVKGELAERVRRAIPPRDKDAPVYIIEESGDNSYSEYTLEQYRDFYVQCGETTREFNSFSGMLDWLDKEAPVQ